MAPDETKRSQSAIEPLAVEDGLEEVEIGKFDEAEEDEPDNQTKNQPPSLARVLALGKPEWGMLFIALVLMVVNEAAGLYNPQLVGHAYDDLVDENLENRMAEISSTMVLVIIIHFSGVAASFARASIMGAAGERIVARLRNRLYSSILKQEIAFFDQTKTGELVSRLSSDTTLIQAATSTAVPEVILGVTKLIASVALMFWISSELAGVTIGFTIIIFAVCLPFGKTIGSLSKSYQDALGVAQTYSTEALGSMRTVQSFAAEDRERKRYSDKIGRPEEFPLWWPTTNEPPTTYGVGFYKSIWTSAFFTFIFGFGFGSMYFSLWYGFKLVDQGKMTLGDLTAFQSYIFQIGSSLAQTSRFLTQVVEARGASGRVFELLERTPQIPAPVLDEGHRFESQPLRLSSFDGHVRFNNVSFAYPSRPGVPVLRHLSLDIPPNTTTALVGSSGAGKSTVVALLQRFYDVNGGSITIDGTDIRNLDLKWMRRHIGYVQQEPQLFGLTVRENVCYGMDSKVVSEGEMIEACRKANAHDFIMQWPKGYDTLVGERGVKLSGGQKQRIAIARSILVNPRILLLDEATSALDAESEHLVQEAIENAAVGRTVLIVAHRLSTIKRATQIVVMGDEHQVDDVGSHDELMERCVKYQDLIHRQSILGLAPPTQAEFI